VSNGERDQETQHSSELSKKNGGMKRCKSREIAPGLHLHSSARNPLLELVLDRLRQDGDIEEAVSPNFLARNWPPAFKEWEHQGGFVMRSLPLPTFPRLLNAET